MLLAGQIQPGKRVGRKLGFPTANICPDDPGRLPAQNGVYAARIFLADGRVLPCVLNKGLHPTLPEGAATVEAHIFDFDEDIYGQRVRVEFLRFLRPETRFANFDALREQIARDEAEARAWFAREGGQGGQDHP